MLCFCVKWKYLFKTLATYGEGWNYRNVVAGGDVFGWGGVSGIENFHSSREHYFHKTATTHLAMFVLWYKKNGSLISFNYQ